MFWVRNLVFEEISKSFCIIFGQETREHIKTIKKRCLEAKHYIFHENAFKQYVFPEGFPYRGAATHRRVFCLDFFGMFRLVWEMFGLFWNV